MSILLMFHLIALGVWIGVVGAEFAIEFDGMVDDASYIKASKMHYQTDLWIEIPAFTVVLLTGLLMLNESHFQGVFLYKVMFASLAIIFNLVCVCAVIKRRKFAISGDIEGMRTTNKAMRIGALVIPAFIISFGLAFYTAM